MEWNRESFDVCRRRKVKERHIRSWNIEKKGRESKVNKLFSTKIASIALKNRTPFALLKLKNYLEIIDSILFSWLQPMCIGKKLKGIE